MPQKTVEELRPAEGSGGSVAREKGTAAINSTEKRRVSGGRNSLEVKDWRAEGFADSARATGREFDACGRASWSFDVLGSRRFPAC